jgi:hypothetical protein
LRINVISAGHILRHAVIRVSHSLVNSN